MSQVYQLLTELISLLDTSGLCDRTQIMETSIFSFEQFAFKIRTTIFSSYSFQIRIYFNEGYCDYSYQVYEKDPLCRWDNKEHFPEIKTFPHHFHTLTDKVIESPLKGNPIDDLNIVLKEIEHLLKNKK
jgi:hypothetical protein